MDPMHSGQQAQPQENFGQGAPTEPPQWVAQFMELMLHFRNNVPVSSPQNSSTLGELSNAQIQHIKRKPRHSQREPEKFTNKDNSQYPQFRSLLEAKLRIDAEAIGDEEERV